MKLPANFKDVIDEAVNIEDARQTPVSVSVIIDSTAPSDVVAHVRSIFASAAPHARITVGYLDGTEAAYTANNDMVVLVAGVDARIGAKASEIRGKGVPVMVVTTLYEQVSHLADQSGFPIPAGDLISPDLSEEDKSKAQEAFEAVFGKIITNDVIDLSVEEPAAVGAAGMGGAGAAGAGAGAGAAGTGAVAARAADAGAERKRGAHAVGAAAEAAGAGAAAAAGGAVAGAVGAHAVNANTATETAAGTPQSIELLRERAVSARMSLRQKAKNIDLAKFLKRGNTEAQQRHLPNLLTEDMMRAFDNRMGEWIIATCRNKRLSFALAFPFVARPLSLEAVNATAVQNAGIGVVVFLPGADMPVMTANQMKMILQIAAAYGQSMTVERVKELLAVLGGAFVARSAARNVAALVPGLGWAVKGGIGYTATIAMGRSAIEYFENGTGLMGATGAVVSVKNAITRAVDKAAGISSEPKMSAQEKNQQTAQVIKDAAGNAAAAGKRALKAVGPLGQQIAEDTARSFKNGINAMKKK